MIPANIQDQFRQKVATNIRLKQEGIDRYRVYTPFGFNDGDHFSIILKQLQGKYLLSDEGHTLMHLTYFIDWASLNTGNRQKIIDATLSAYEIKNDEGELVAHIEDDKFGDALFSYIQGLVKISDVTYLTQERVRSTFLEDFRSFVRDNVEPKRYVFDYVIPEFDPEKKYSVDCKINRVKKPLFVFAIQNNDQCRDATIKILQYEKWKIDFSPVTIFQDQEQINRRVLARYSDVSGKQFSSLQGNTERIHGFVNEYLKENT